MEQKQERIYKLWTEVNEDLFYKFIHRAQVERIFASKDGFVDINKVLFELVDDFANGNHFIGSIGNVKESTKQLYVKG